MKSYLALSVAPQTKIALDAVSALLQKSPSSVVESMVSCFLTSLPEEQRRAVEALKAAAVANMEAAPTCVAGAVPAATYRFSRLCFRRDVIEPIGQSETFRVVTPVGTFQMTKSDFYREFENVVESKSYRVDGIYHYPKLPARAERYRIS